MKKRWNQQRARIGLLVGLGLSLGLGPSMGGCSAPSGSASGEGPSEPDDASGVASPGGEVYEERAPTEEPALDHASDYVLKEGAPPAAPGVLTGEYTDPRDGNTYTWVQHGNLQWMQQNLAYLGTDGEPETQYVDLISKYPLRTLVARAYDSETEAYPLEVVDSVLTLIGGSCGSTYCLEGEPVQILGALARYVVTLETDDIDVALASKSYQDNGVVYTYAEALSACNAADGWRLPRSFREEGNDFIQGELATLLQAASDRPEGDKVTSYGPFMALLRNTYPRLGKRIRSNGWNGWPNYDECIEYLGDEIDECADYTADYLVYGDDIALLDLRGTGHVSDRLSAYPGFHFSMWSQDSDAQEAAARRWEGELPRYAYLRVSPESDWDISYAVNDDDNAYLADQGFNGAGTSATSAFSVRCVRDVQ